MLTQDEKSELLQVARNAIREAFGHKKEVEYGTPRKTSDLRPDKRSQWLGRLAEPSGAFVTIRLRGDLRGCIGYIEAPIALGEVVREVAAKAAFEDPRFPPLTEVELRNAVLEVSVLSPLRKVTSPEEVVVGTHGALIELGRQRGLLLPQVPIEYGWDRDTFLDNLARKAGLPSAAWKDPQAEIFVFTAEVIEENPFSHLHRELEKK